MLVLWLHRLCNVTVRRSRSVELNEIMLRSLNSVTPGRKLVQLGNLVVGDLAEDPSESGLRVDLVEFGSFDQGKGNGHGC